ncbi:hypothetical protein A2635_01975 [Candidatus Peribacteria bacterium RIFCSPHIGHO2_01_FULL_51_9]|nr:MAG: hypothetical protein A2635_01975 [Candidatus Peribacteria bacterium RIFCSPHIGHO2_01_FULL_51_9]
MPRSLVFGNGQMLATFDERAQLRDLYFPYVGMEDHTAYGDIHRVGFWVTGKGFAWLSDQSWTVTPQYQKDTLVGNSVLRNDTLGIEITAQDYVHPVRNILVRNFLIRSTDNQEKEVRVFFHHDLHIYGDKQKDTAFYEPYMNVVIHYRQSRYFLIGGTTDAPTRCMSRHTIGAYQSILPHLEQSESCGISAYSIGKSDYRNFEGTWRDAEEGELANSSVEQGSVDSTIGIYCTVPPNTQTKVTMWMCLGKTLNDIVELHQFALREGNERMQRNCDDYWQSWVRKTPRDFDTLDSKTIDLFHRSLLTIRAHADNHGGIVAAADADIMAFNRDTYTYVWPRDAAFVCMALDGAGYSEVTRRFFEFCSRIQTPDGYLLHKYNPDGSLGSSWHPWFRDGEVQLPIQEDETALVLCALWQHFHATNDFEFLQTMYESFLKKAAKFLCNFREPQTGLPLASYDPWEEHRGIFTYTTACTIAGLHAAVNICHSLGHFTHEKQYQTAEDEIRQSFLFHLYDEETGRFLKKIKRKNGQTTERDRTVDANIMTVWKLGILPSTDPRTISTMQQVEEHLTVRTPIGGIARYENDRYHAQVPSSAEIPGNPWIITTLWNAQWKIETAKSMDDLAKPRQILEWATSHASATGMLPEQLHPLTGAPLSVAPLSWSHAAFVETVLQFIQKERLLKNKK